MKIRFALFAVTLAFVLLNASDSNVALGQRDFKPRVLLNSLPAIVDPNIVSAEEADENLGPDELVIGVVVNGKARAYPINMLTGPRREIINDQLGNQAIAATW